MFIFLLFYSATEHVQKGQITIQDKRNKNNEASTGQKKPFNAPLGRVRAYIAAAWLHPLLLQAETWMKYSVKCSRAIMWNTSRTPISRSSTTVDGVVVAFGDTLEPVLGVTDVFWVPPDDDSVAEVGGVVVALGAAVLCSSTACRFFLRFESGLF